MHLYLRLILFGFCCVPFVGCERNPDSPLENKPIAVQAPEPPEPNESAEEVVSTPRVVEPVVTSAERVETEARRPLAPRPAPRHLEYSLSPVGKLTDARGRLMQARIIAANDTQVRVQREDGLFFTLDLDILSPTPQSKIRKMEGLPQLDTAGQALFPVYDFGAKGDGETDDGPAIRAAVAAAIESGPDSVVVFDDLEYRMLRHRGGAQVTLDSVSGLTLEGNGATIIGTPYNGFLSVTKSEDITMRGFVFDCDPLGFTQGDIVEANPATGELRLKLHSGYANPVELTEQLGKKSWDEVGFTIERDERKLKPGPIDRIETITEESRAEGLLHLKLKAGSFSHINVGDRFVFGLVYGSKGANFRIRESSNVLLEDYTIYSAKYGMNHGFSDSRGRIRVNGAKIVHKPGSDRLITSIKDGFHVKHNAVGPIIENCVIEGIMDDAINISVCPYWVKEDLGSNRYLVAEVSYSPRVGDRLKAYTPQTGKISQELRVLSVEAQTSQKRRRGKWNVIQLDRPIPDLALHTVDDLFPGGPEKLVFTGLYNLDACGKDFIVRNNTFLEQRRYALLARGVGGLFEGNVVNNNNGSGVMLCNEMGSFYEGPFPAKITIRDNEFIRNGWDPIRIHIKGKGVWATDILIEDNVFDDWPEAAMKLSHIDGLVVRNNTIRPGRNQDVAASPIQLTSCKNVQIESNTITTDSTNGLTLVGISKLLVRGNSFNNSAGRPMSNPVNQSRVSDARIDL